MNNKEVFDIFPTPIFKYHIEDHKEINSELEKHIYDLRKKIQKETIILTLEDGTQKILI